MKLYRSYRWKMIPNCTGRYTCRDHNLVSILEPLEMLRQVDITTLEDSSPLREYSFVLPGRPDKVVVIPLNVPKTTGIITFAKEDRSSYVHTLNTPTGFRRKLEAIGIQVTNEDIFLANTNDSPDAK